MKQQEKQMTLKSYQYEKHGWIICENLAKSCIHLHFPTHLSLHVAEKNRAKSQKN